MKEPILVVLAAGIGSRYGGLKQVDRIGTSGEALLDYSVYDALRSGFEKVIFIIRHDIEKDFRELVLSRMGTRVPYELAFQDADTLIPPDVYAEAQRIKRVKPWGTSHALLCAADKIDAPFAVINADDFYSKEAFEVLSAHLTAEQNEGALVPYRLDKTLSPQGSVARGVCGIADGYLVSVEELTAISRRDGRIFNTALDGTERDLAPDTPVSMNFWGFPPEAIPYIRCYFEEFLKTSVGDPKRECYIPHTVDWLIRNKTLSFKALSAEADWFGVTYKEDKASTTARVAELVARGVYPASLWS
ncbi:MAG: hypothetical protein LBJ41_04240 [Treponema sp.]|jgi:hypothetical protein|nr:hypothetical protein [Treponema sp.]